jgi:hypothetical protein
MPAGIIAVLTVVDVAAAWVLIRVMYDTCTDVPVGLLVAVGLEITSSWLE